MEVYHFRATAEALRLGLLKEVFH